MKNHSRLSLPLVTATLAFSNIACFDAIADDNVATLQPMSVTATRSVQPVSQTLAAVTVITRADIERLQVSSVEELLGTSAGVSMVNNGGRGKNTSLFIRGAESDHLVVLIDGVKIGSATSGTSPFQMLPIDQIERIEIVRGPRSALYGSEAIGGVVQIFTRQASGEGFRPGLALSAGSHNSYKGSGSLSYAAEDFTFNLSASVEDTDGFNACTGAAFAGCFVADPDPDDDGYKNTSYAARAAYQATSWFRVEAQLMQVSDEVEYDSAGAGPFFNAPNGSESELTVYGGKVIFTPSSSTSLSLAAGRSSENGDNLVDGVFESNFDTRRDTLNGQFDWQIDPAQRVTIGADYQNDQVTSNTAFTVTERDNKAGYVQYQYYGQSVEFVAGLRSDDNEQFGDKTTGNLGLGFLFGNGLRLSAGYGTAFKAPTFNELYWPFAGNVNLAPEKSETIELSLSGSFWEIRLFDTSVDDLIIWDSADTTLGAFGGPSNISEASIQGAEFEMFGDLLGWQVRASLTLLDAKDESGGVNDGNELARRPDQSARLDLDRSFGKLSVGSSITLEGQRYDDVANSRSVGGYATVDLRTSFELTESWSLGGKVNNVLDKSYQLASYYPQDGINFMITVRYQGQ